MRNIIGSLKKRQKIFKILKERIWFFVYIRMYVYNSKTNPFIHADLLVFYYSGRKFPVYTNFGRKTLVKILFKKEILSYTFIRKKIPSKANREQRL
jgi:hypothetical protein